MRFAFIQAHAELHDVSLLCRLLQVSRSGYYDWLGRDTSERERGDGRLKILIRSIHKRSRGLYGAPRVHAELRAQGKRVGRKRVARLMREEGLEGRSPRRRGVRTTKSSPETVGENLLERDFSAEAPNRVWAADTTYLHTNEGWAFLVAILDLFSRRVVGWAVSPELSTDLARAALRKALRLRLVEPGLVFHTDRGGEFTSTRFGDDLKAVAAKQSLSRSGDCYDNAAMESFFGTLKDELDVTQGRTFESAEDAERVIGEYIERYYNRERRHSAIGYAIPVDFEANASQAALAA